MKPLIRKLPIAIGVALMAASYPSAADSESEFNLRVSALLPLGASGACAYAFNAKERTIRTQCIGGIDLDRTIRTVARVLPVALRNSDFTGHYTTPGATPVFDGDLALARDTTETLPARLQFAAGQSDADVTIKVRDLPAGTAIGASSASEVALRNSATDAGVLITPRPSDQIGQELEATRASAAETERDLNARIDELTTASAKLETRLKATEEELNRSKATIAAVRTSAGIPTASPDSQVASAIDHLNTEGRALATESAINRNVRAQLELASAQIKGDQKSIQVAQSNLDKARNALKQGLGGDSVPSAKMVDETADLVQSLMEVRAGNEALASQNEDLKRSLAVYRGNEQKYQQATRESAEAQARYKLAMAQLEASNSDLAAAKSESARVASLLNAALVNEKVSDADRRALQATLATAIARADALEASRTELSGRTGALQAKVEESVRSQSALSESMAQMRRDLDATNARVIALRRANDAASDVAYRLRGELDASSSRNETRTASALAAISTQSKLLRRQAETITRLREAPAPESSELVEVAQSNSPSAKAQVAPGVSQDQPSPAPAPVTTLDSRGAVTSSPRVALSAGSMPADSAAQSEVALRNSGRPVWNRSPESVPVFVPAPASNAGAMRAAQVADIHTLGGMKDQYVVAVGAYSYNPTQINLALPDGARLFARQMVQANNTVYVIYAGPFTDEKRAQEFAMSSPDGAVPKGAKPQRLAEFLY